MCESEREREREGNCFERRGKKGSKYEQKNWLGNNPLKCFPIIRATITSLQQ